MVFSWQPPSLYTKNRIQAITPNLVGTTSQAEAGARAILRQGLSHDGKDFRTRSSNGLHPMFFYTGGGWTDQSLSVVQDKNNVLRDTKQDISDAITALDRMDGGVSLFLRCPGYTVETREGVSDLLLDAFVSSREYCTAGFGFRRDIQNIVQTFGEKIAIDHLVQFTERCAAEGLSVIPPPVSSMDNTDDFYDRDTGQYNIRICMDASASPGTSDDGADVDIDVDATADLGPLSHHDIPPLSADLSSDDEGYRTAVDEEPTLD